MRAREFISENTTTLSELYKNGFNMKSHEFITEVFDLGTDTKQPPDTFPLEWDDQFSASHNDVGAEAHDDEGRVLYISFTPIRLGDAGTATEIAFTRGGRYDMTGHGDAIKVMKTVAWAIKHYLETYRKPNYLMFSSKGSSRTSTYTKMLIRLLREYKLLSPDEFPPEFVEWSETLGYDEPFVLEKI
jgi:hypothetical protein